MPTRRAPHTPRAGLHELAPQTRAAQLLPATFDEAANSIDVVFSTGARAARYDPWDDARYEEELEISPAALDLSRVDAGAVQVLDNHDRHSGLGAVLGTVTRAWVAGNEARATLRLTADPAKAGIVADIKSGVIRAISVGYSVQRYEVTTAADRKDGGGVDLWRATRWQPYEISFVSVPADPTASTRSADATARGAPCEFIPRGQSAARNQEEGTMPAPSEQTAVPSDSAPATAPAASPATPTPPAQPGEHAALPPVTPEAARAADATRSADVLDLCAKHGVPELASGLIRSGASIGSARDAVLNAIAARDRASGGHHNAAGVRTVTDETDVRMRGMAEALLSRLDPQIKLDDNARHYRGLSLIEMGREHLAAAGVQVRGLDRMGIAARMTQVRAAGMHTTSDFGYLFGTIANRRLRTAYEAAPGTYPEWARRGPNMTDFKPVAVVGMGAGPELLKVNEHGEYKYGTFSDSAETYQLATYGRIVAMTRQAIINDDLRGWDRLITLFAASAARLENRLVYEQLAGNQKMSDGQPLFSAAHNNLLTGATAALALGANGDPTPALAALQAARAKMRAQKGTDGERLNISPKYLIVPSALETVAYQLTSNAFTPARLQDVNDFRSGGRTPLQVIVEPALDDASPTAWYLAADSSGIDTVEYAYLEGADGPETETREGFEVDGTEIKCRLDFAAKALDWRGLVKAAGA